MVTNDVHRKHLRYGSMVLVMPLLGRVDGLIASEEGVALTLPHARSLKKVAVRESRALMRGRHGNNHK
jgi:hypothetical protein